VCLYDLSLDAKAFESVGTGSYPAGMSLNKIEDHLNVASDELTQLKFDTETRKLNFKSGRLDAMLALINPDSIRNEPDLPDLELPNEIQIEVSEFKAAVKACELSSDHIGIRAEEDLETVTFYAEGDIDEMTYAISADECDVEADDTYVNLREAGYSLLSIDYVEDIMKAADSVTDADAVINIVFGVEFPVQFGFEYADGNGDVMFNLAPRIESN